MQKATATYRAPPGDAKVCEMGGVTFHDGKSVELNSYDHAHMISKLPGNPHFDVTIGEDDKKPPTVEKKRGRPSNADKAAAKAASEEADRLAKEAAEKAKVAKADLEEINKVSDAKVEPAKYTPANTGAQGMQTPAPAPLYTPPTPTIT